MQNFVLWGYLHKCRLSAFQFISSPVCPLISHTGEGWPTKTPAWVQVCETELTEQPNTSELELGVGAGWGFNFSWEGYCWKSCPGHRHPHGRTWMGSLAPKIILSPGCEGEAARRWCSSWWSGFALLLCVSYLARAVILDTGNFFCMWGPDLFLEVVCEIQTCLGVHGTVVLSELFQCMERSEVKRI